MPRPEGLVLESVQLADEIQRSRLDLVVDPPDVFADDADDHQLNAADERRHEDDRQPARDEERG